jgi:hypothetical protein
MDTIEKEINEIEEIIKRKLKTDKEFFYDRINQVALHIIKLTKLKENEDRPDHFKEEVTDLYILASLLMKSEGVDEKTKKIAAQHFLDKVREKFK